MTNITISDDEIDQATLTLSGLQNAAFHLTPGKYEGDSACIQRYRATFAVLKSQQALTSDEIEKRLSIHIQVLDSLFFDVLTMVNACQQSEKKASLLESALKVQSASLKTAQAIETIRNPKKPAMFIKKLVDKELNILSAQNAEPLPESHQTPYGGTKNATREGYLENECLETWEAHGIKS